MEYFPTDFAIQIGRNSELYPDTDIEEINCKCETGKKKEKAKAEQMLKTHGRLSSFQGMCTTGSFKEAMIAYDGIEITKKQKKVLKKIHRSTNTWAKGDLVGKILEQLKSTTSSRSIKELSETVMKIIEPDENGGSASSDGFKALIVQTYSEEK